MDIEGAEKRAIIGSRRTRDDYEIYLRHYSESIYETVMYFI